MNKKEVLELKRRLKKDQATFSRLVGCYVDCNHEKVCKFGGKFLGKPVNPNLHVGICGAVK